MGQYWKVVCADKKEQLTTLCWGKIGAIWPGYNLGFILEQRLMVPRPLQPALFGLENRYPDIDSVKSRALTEQENKSMQGTFKNDVGDWAQQRIICIGDYTTTLPGSLCDLQIAKEPHTILQQLYAEESRERGNIATDILPEEHEQQQRFKRAFSHFYDFLFPPEEGHVLVNLTAKRFVIDLSGKKHHYSFEHPRPRTQWGLGDAVMANICWSGEGDSSTALSCKENFDCNGSWAGHRFAIISESVFRRVTEGDREWKDVTKETADQLDRIWTSEVVQY